MPHAIVGIGDQRLVGQPAAGSPGHRFIRCQLGESIHCLPHPEAANPQVPILWPQDQRASASPTGAMEQGTLICQVTGSWHFEVLERVRHERLQGTEVPLFLQGEPLSFPLQPTPLTAHFWHQCTLIVPWMLVCARATNRTVAGQKPKIK